MAAKSINQSNYHLLNSDIHVAIWRGSRLIGLFGRHNLVNSLDSDIFGTSNVRKALDFPCPNCDRPVASSRFAPHLEKCMGLCLLLLFCIFSPPLCLSEQQIIRWSNWNWRAWFFGLFSGIGRNSSRIASRRIANTRDGNNYYSGSLTDDEDDVDWASDKKKKRLQSMRSNGSKKNGKSSNN